MTDPICDTCKNSLILTDRIEGTYTCVYCEEKNADAKRKKIILSGSAVYFYKIIISIEPDIPKPPKEFLKAIPLQVTKSVKDESDEIQEIPFQQYTVMIESDKKIVPGNKDDSVNLRIDAGDEKECYDHGEIYISGWKYEDDE